jgi:FixJ family two-component response regulator
VRGLVKREAPVLGSVDLNDIVDEVLRHVLGGQTKRIAASLGTAEKTVKIQRGRVMQKMQAASLARVVIAL